MSTAAKTRTLKVETLSRVEGEGALYIKLAAGHAPEVKLRVYEPPRFFEALLRGRDWSEVPDITARICGICSASYQVAASQAIEDAFGTAVDPQIRALRRLLYCGEWIESHALHILLLHAPDYLGYPDGLALAKDHPDLVRRGLTLKKCGNDLITAIGGREIHAVNACPGGFFKMPGKARLLGLIPALTAARDTALDLLALVRGFDFPEFQQDYEFVAVRHPGEYAMCEGRLVSNRGLDIGADAFGDAFVEKHVAHSNALHGLLRARGSYLVGPLARYHLNFDQLPVHLQNLAASSGIGPPCLNPFRGIIVRAIETIYACEEAVRLIDEYRPAELDRSPVTPRAAWGFCCTEAPRGVLHHAYEFEAEGHVVSARIVPPTSQNQKRMEDDLRALLPQLAAATDQEITHRCEQAVRNYDPCISCATHFLRTRIERM